jgi:response regulator RpfG family c-di-GMP phosphodiesterase
MAGMVTELADHPILVVDDELPNLELIERFLRRKYKKIITAEDGEQALWILETKGVDLILADQKMPKITGTDLLHQARELQPAAMRILVTGNGDVETLTAAINAAQVFQVVTKPIDFKLMEMVVQRALEAHEAAAREHQLFDAFVYASVSAMEQRDPSTAGHSFRVAMMTTGLAMATDRATTGALASVRFSRDEVAQIRYASLLHDFGKIGVPEEVLVKARKLPPIRAKLFQQRIRTAVAMRKLPAPDGKRYEELLQLLDDPTISSSAHQAELALLEESGLSEPEDLRYLRIERGSLSPEERRAIEAHVLGTIKFLRQIPWPRRFSRVVEIAGAHHEKLNGSGYPYGNPDVPIESRMMTICDVYDALCASDRPYRVAASHERAVEILWEMVKLGETDRDLTELFLERKVYKVLKHRQARHPFPE